MGLFPLALAALLLPNPASNWTPITARRPRNGLRARPLGAARPFVSGNPAGKRKGTQDRPRSKRMGGLFSFTALQVVRKARRALIAHAVSLPAPSPLPTENSRCAEIRAARNGAPALMVAIWGPAMRTRSSSHCLLCELEFNLKQQLRELDSQENFSNMTASSFLLSAFPNSFALTAHLRSCRSNGNGTHPADGILHEILHLRHRNGGSTVLRDILLLAFIPVLHSAVRQLNRRYPLLSDEDTAQHLVASLLEALDSQELLARNSHLAFAISRMAKRSMFEWAERQTRTPGNAERDEPLAALDVVCGISEPIEQAVLLRHFLCRCQREGLLTGSDLELLVHIKLEGNFAEQNGEYSNALRQKIKRLLQKLRKAARRPSPAATPEGAKEST